MSNKLTLVAISGSLRKNSYNTALIYAAQEVAADFFTIENCDISQLPLYNEDLRNNNDFPAVVGKLRQKIAAADGLLIVGPEYNRSISGVLKNAIDWASRPPQQPFDNKPVAIMGVSPSAAGALMANHATRQILVYLNANLLNGPEVAIGNAMTKFDHELKLTDQATAEYMKAHLEKFYHFISQYKK